MRIAALDKVQLHWREDGDADGVPVVFANSLGTDLRLWDKVVQRLPGGLRLVRFDRRGQGLSCSPKGPYSLEDLTDDTEQLLAHLGIGSCVFVGLSIGGMIGQALAARRPDLVRALVLSNTAARMGEAQMWTDRIAAIEMGGIESLAGPILERWFSAAFRATEEVSAWRNMLVRTPQEGYIGCCHAIAGTDLTDRTSSLRMAVLGIGGSEDGASPPELVRASTALVPGSRFAEITGAGHLPCVERPDDFVALLNAFVKEVADD